MKININRHLFSQTDVDSGSISGFSSIVHKFSKPGDYEVTIIRDSNIVYQFSIDIVGESPDGNSQSSQIHIDLSLPSNNYILKTGGYALFYNSKGPGGYAVEVHKRAADTKTNMIFDSHELKDDDIFSTMILRSGTYSITNVLNDTKAELVVNYPIAGKTKRNPLPINFICTSKEISPNNINVDPSQGLVFNCKTPSRIKIELVKPDDGPAKIQKEQTLEQKQSKEKIIRSYRIMPRTT